MTPTATEKRTKTPALTYTAFIASLQLHTVNLKEASCNIDRDQFWSEEDKDISYKFTSEPVTIEGDRFDARTTLDVTMTTEKSKKHVLKISASFDLHLHAKEAPKEYVTNFCKGEIRLIVWPYFREFVMDISGRMYIPPIILPLSDKKDE